MPKSTNFNCISAKHDAVAAAQKRCFRFSWVLDMDISRFFDTIDHELLMKAIQRHVNEKRIFAASYV